VGWAAASDEGVVPTFVESEPQEANRNATSNTDPSRNDLVLVTRVIVVVVI